MQVDHLPRTSGIYKITCTANGRFYIGSSVDIRKRLKEHYRTLLKGEHHSIHLQRCFNRYGESNFHVEIMLFCSKAMLIFYEQRFLDMLKPTLNVCLSAKNALGVIRSDETKAKISASKKGSIPYNKGVPCKEDVKIKISLTKKGSKHSLETRRRMSSARMGNTYNLGTKRSDECKAQMSARMMGNTNSKGVIPSKETREKLSLANKGKTMSPEARAKISKSLLGHKHTDFTKAKISNSKKGKPQNPESVDARAASCKKTWERKRLEKQKTSLDFSKEVDVN